MPPTIIEIFQSQSCSACPPTYSNLLSLLTNPTPPRPPLLTYHVTYWDHAGWRDTFAHQVFNDRQHDYVKRLGLKSGAFTPMVVVGGRVSEVVKGLEELKGLVGKGDEVSKDESGVRLEVDRSTEDDLCEAMINVFRGEVQGDLDLWLVKYDPKTVKVEILTGENQGRRLPYRNVVKSVEKIGFFEGEERDGSFFVDMDGKGTLGFVVLVQQGYGGPVVGVAEL
jgi:hypothetical protein